LLLNLHPVPRRCHQRTIKLAVTNLPQLMLKLAELPLQVAIVDNYVFS
jgi:hypothetical protein